MSYNKIELNGDWLLVRKVGHGAYVEVGGVRTRMASPDSPIAIPDSAKTDVEEIFVVYAGPGWYEGKDGVFRDCSGIAGKRHLIRGMRTQYDESIEVGGEKLLLVRARDLIGCVE